MSRGATFKELALTIIPALFSSLAPEFFQPFPAVLRLTVPHLPPLWLSSYACALLSHLGAGSSVARSGKIPTSARLRPRPGLVPYQPAHWNYQLSPGPPYTPLLAYIPLGPISYHLITATPLIINSLPLCTSRTGFLVHRRTTRTPALHHPMHITSTYGSSILPRVSTGQQAIIVPTRPGGASANTETISMPGQTSPPASR